MLFRSDALIFYPGGFGTLNEFFEYVTLIQTKMTDPVPLICVNKNYWQGLFGWINDKAVTRGFVDLKTLKSIHIVDTPEEILKIIHNS